MGTYIFYNIAIVGGRRVNSYTFVKDYFLEIMKQQGFNINDIIIVSGGAKGVDTFAKKIADEFNLTLIEIRPEWDKYGKSAGYKRNRTIVELADILIAIPDLQSVGTYHSITLAKQKGIPVFVKQFNQIV